MDIADVMRPFVVTVRPEASLDAVEELLLDTGFAMVPVVESNRLVGVVDLDDLPLSPAATPLPRHRRGGPRTVGEVMTRAVTVAGPSMRAEDVLRLLRVTRLSSVPVLRDGALVGVVARRDLADARSGSPVAARHRPTAEVLS